MPRRPHILVVNGRKVRQPVFVISAPHSGADLLGRALKQSPGFHLTIGQEAVQSVVYAFARSPSIQRGKSDAAATVLRDAFAQAWQVTGYSCLTCAPFCREAGGVSGPASCVSERDIARYGDASPDLMYCADTLVDAFPDAKLVQIIRDGRDVVAAMLADIQALNWFKPGIVNVQAEFPNPFLGIETEHDLAIWPELSDAGKCAMRWRGSVRSMARLRTAMSAEQLTTLRYEGLIGHPAASAAAVADFIDTAVEAIQVRTIRREGQPSPEPGAWRRHLSTSQLSEIEAVAGPDLRRVGYGE
ncbi:MAG TPA: sulfotransferase [Streptosporangiaceae bacterium]|nr:sulfotransferase [Streptosporangiaceae bacterium]